MAPSKTPTDAREPARRRRSPVAAVISLAVVTIAVMVGGSLFAVHALREQEIDLWRRQLDNLSLIMAENTAQTMSPPTSCSTASRRRCATRRSRPPRNCAA